MNKISFLGEFEQMVLLAILRLGEEAYGKTIRAELEKRAGRSVSRSATYITLERLIGKGYLTARMGDASPQREGRPRRYFALTNAGREALKVSGRALRNLWAGYETLLDET